MASSAVPIPLSEDHIQIQNEKKTTMIPTNSFALQGRHNLLNAMAAATIADLLKISKSVIRESLSTFQGVPHRLEKVLKIQKKQLRKRIVMRSK